MYKTARYRLQFWTDFHEIPVIGSTHGWTLLFLETRGPIETHIWGKVWPKTSYSGVSQTVWDFSKKKFKNIIRHPISHTKGYIHFCCLTSHSLKNGHAPQKLFFAVILENIVFFEKIVKWKIFKTSRPSKKVILIFIARRPPLPRKTVYPPTNSFSNFSKNSAFFEKLVEL